MNFADVLRGTRAVRPITFALPDGRRAACGVRALHHETEELALLEDARRRALADGGTTTPGDKVFDGWLYALTAVAACVDPDSPPDDPRPFFAGVEELREGLDAKQIEHIFTEQIRMQASVAYIDDAAGDFAERLLGLEPGDDGLRPIDLAARYSTELYGFYGRPAALLTGPQILAWLSFRNRAEARMSKKGAG